MVQMRDRKDASKHSHHLNGLTSTFLEVSVTIEKYQNRTRERRVRNSD